MKRERTLGIRIDEETRQEIDRIVEDHRSWGFTRSDVCYVILSTFLNHMDEESKIQLIRDGILELRFNGVGERTEHRQEEQGIQPGINSDGGKKMLSPEEWRKKQSSKSD